MRIYDKVSKSMISFEGMTKFVIVSVVVVHPNMLIFHQTQINVTTTKIFDAKTYNLSQVLNSCENVMRKSSLLERVRESGLASTCCTPLSVSSVESAAQPRSAMATVLVEKRHQRACLIVAHRGVREERHDVECGIAEETMSAVVKLAKKIGESCDVGQPTVECQLMRTSRRKLVTKSCELRQQKTPRSVSWRCTLRIARRVTSLPWRKDMTSNAGAVRRRQGYDVSFFQPAKEVYEPDISQPTAECLLMVWPSRRRLVSSGGELLPAQGGSEGTEERVLALHTMSL